MNIAIKVNRHDSRIKDALKAALPSYDPFESKKISTKEIGRFYSALISKNGFYDSQLLFNIFLDHCIKTDKVAKDINYSQPILIPRQASPINTGNNKFLLGINKFNIEFIKYIDTLEDASDQRLFSSIVYSAIRFGLLLDSKLLASLSLELYNPPNKLGDTVWFNLNTDINNPDVNSIFAWQPDTLTLLLINIWYNKTRLNKKRHWYESIKSELDDSCCLPTRTSDFIDTLASLQKTKIPSFLVESNQSRINNKSIEYSCFLQQTTSMSPPISPASLPRRITRDPKEKSNLEIFKTRFMRTLKISDDNHSIANSLSSLVNHSTIPRSIEALSNCIIHYLTHKNEYNKICRNSWHQRIFSQLFTQFSEKFGDNHPEDLTDSDLKYNYLEIAKSYDQESLSNIKKYIRAFHYYLHLNHGKGFNTQLLPKIKTKDTTKNITSGSIISEDQYILMLEWVTREFNSATISNKPIFQAMRMCLILGFRIGLRRSECLGIRLMDIHTTNDTQLIIREYEGFRLKSRNSIRQISLQHQMPDDELAYIIEYTLSRQKEDKKTLLINWKGAGRKKNRMDHIFSRIRKLLRLVSGRNDARFHELRHSRATFKIYHCYAVAYNHLSSTGPDISHEELERARGYLDNNVEYQNGGNKHKILRYISREMGHASPKTTLTSYIHSLDWILHDHREKAIPKLRTKALSRLTNLSPRQIQKRLVSYNAKKTSSDITQGYHSPIFLRAYLIDNMRNKAEKITLDNWRNQCINDLPIDSSVIQHRYLPELEALEALKRYYTGTSNLKELKSSFPKIKNSLEVLINKENRLKLLVSIFEKRRVMNLNDYLVESIISAFTNTYDHENGRNKCRKEDRCEIKEIAADITQSNSIDQQTQHGYSFVEKRKLQRFIKIIRLLNSYQDAGPPIEIELTLYSNDSLISESRAQLWQKWLKATQLPKQSTFNNIVNKKLNYEKIKVMITDAPLIRAEEAAGEEKQYVRESKKLYSSSFNIALRFIALLDDILMKS